MTDKYRQLTTCMFAYYSYNYYVYIINKIIILNVPEYTQYLHQTRLIGHPLNSGNDDMHVYIHITYTYIPFIIHHRVSVANYINLEVQIKCHSIHDPKTKSMWLQLALFRLKFINNSNQHACTDPKTDINVAPAGSTSLTGPVHPPFMHWLKFINNNIIIVAAIYISGQIVSSYA